MLELKAISILDNIQIAQTMNYLEAYKVPIGLLINFGGRSLDYRRIYNTKHPDNIEYRKTPL